MSDTDLQRAHDALASLHDEIAAAVRAWRGSGGRDDELALWVDGEHPEATGGKPKVTTHVRKKLMRTIPDFQTTIAVEFAKHPAGKAPAVVDLRDDVRHIVWFDLPSR